MGRSFRLLSVVPGTPCPRRRRTARTAQAGPEPALIARSLIRKVGTTFRASREAGRNEVEHRSAGEF